MPIVRLLGGIQFETVPAASELMARPKTLTLLAWLAARCDEGPRRREEAQALFWPDTMSSAARNSLRQAVFRLRQALGHEAIQGDRGAIWLSTDHVGCDVVDLDRALRDGRDREAVELYRGDLMHGLVLPRSPDIMAWLTDARTARRVKVIDAAARLAEQAEAVEDVDGTLRWARRAAELMLVEDRPSSQLASLITRAESVRSRRVTPSSFDSLLDRATRMRFPDDRERGAWDPVVSVSEPPPAAQHQPMQSGHAPVRVASAPLLNMSGDRTDDALAGGLALALAEALGALDRGIERIASTSARQLQSAAVEVVAMVDRLHADAILCGTISRQGEELALALQLLGREGNVLWADRITGSAANIDGLIRCVVDGVIRVLPRGQATATAASSRSSEHSRREVRHRRRDGRSSEAVVAVLRGSHFVWRLTPHDLQMALACFEEAARLDPDSAPAWAGMGQTLLFLPIYSATAPHDAYPRSIEALDRAIALDPDYATGHAARAVAAAVWEWDFQGARRRVDLAHALDPSDHEAWVADLLYVCAPQGRAVDAITAAQRLVSLDPASPLSLAYASIGTAFFDATTAETYARDALTLEPSLPTAHWCLAGLALGAGQIGRALDHADLVVELTGGHPGFRALRAFYSACAGRSAQAQDELGTLLALPALPETDRYYAALTLLHLGDRERALAALEVEVQAHNSMAIYLGVDVALGPLYGDARFEALRRRVGV